MSQISQLLSGMSSMGRQMQRFAVSGSPSRAPPMFWCTP